MCARRWRLITQRRLWFIGRAVQLVHDFAVRVDPARRDVWFGRVVEGVVDVDNSADLIDGDDAPFLAGRRGGGVCIIISRIEIRSSLTELIWAEALIPDGRLINWLRGFCGAARVGARVVDRR